MCIRDRSEDGTWRLIRQPAHYEAIGIEPMTIGWYGGHAFLVKDIKKVANIQLAIPDEVYNWLVNFFDGHSHCTHYRRELSTMSAITTSIIQGSSIGPPSYVVNSGDLKPITPGNQMVKFADDTYIIIPAVN